MMRINKYIIISWVFLGLYFPAFATEAPHPIKRVRELHVHEKLYKELTQSIDGLYSSLHDSSQAPDSSFGLFAASLREDIFLKVNSFKKLTETILNAPRFNLMTVSVDHQVMSFQDYLLESFPESRQFIPIHRRLFWTDNLRNVDTYTLSEKQVVFEHYQSIFRLLKRLLYVENQDDLESYQVLQKDYQLALTAEGVTDFDLMSVRPKYKLQSQDSYSIILDPLSEESKVEIEGLALIQGKKNWKRLLKRHALEMLMSRWRRLDEVWMEDRFPKQERFSILPLSCQHQFPSVVPLSIPIRL